MFEMDKDSSICLISGYDVNARMKIIKRWQELESKKQFDIPTTFGEALLLAGKLAIENETMAKQIEVLEPKARSFVKLSKANGSHAITYAAKILDVEPKALFVYLKELKWIYRLGKSPWAGTKSALNQGLVEQKDNLINGTMRHQCNITALGITTLVNLLKN